MKANKRLSTPSRGRCGLVWCCITSAAVATVAGVLPALDAAWRAVERGAPLSFDTLLVGVAAVTATGCVLWLWLVATVTTLEAASGRLRDRAHGCPAAWRRLVLQGCGVALASGLLVPASAVEIARSAPDDRSAGLLRGLPLPTRPTDRLAESPRVAEPAGDRVVVAAGDSLWSIAAARLPTRATDGRVVAAWRRLYRANRSVIGQDPDLILPGQRLRVPEGPRR